MRRSLAAAALAAPLLLLGYGGLAVAGNLFGLLPNQGPCSYGMGCGGCCLNMFPRIHQHGPLYNYGPYYGYPPFEPYGPWNAYLHYNPAFFGTGDGGHGGHAKGNGNPHPLFGSHGGGLLHGNRGCGTAGCGGGGLLHGGKLGGGHKGSSCSSCGCVATAAAHVNSGPALARYNGYGSPEASTAYYYGTVGLTQPEGGVSVGYFGN